MESWPTTLSSGIEKALKRGEPCKVVVHSETQAELGKRTVKRMVSQIGGNQSHVAFEVSERYPVGTVLVP